MDSHITGPRGKNAYGAILSAIGLGITFGAAAETGKEICRTYGASVANPLLLRITGVITTTFNGTAPAFSVEETNLDGTESATVANIAAFTAGTFELRKVLEVDKIYKLIYTLATGTTPVPSEGKGHYFIEVCGPGRRAL